MEHCAYIADLLISNRRSVFVDNLPIPLVAVLAIISLLFKPLAAVDFTIVALLTSLMIYRAVVSGSQSSSGPLLRQCSRLLVWLGIISYSLYLIHQPFLELVNHYIKKHHFLTASPLSAVFALMLLLAPLALLASLVYRWIELPGIVIGRQVESWFEPVAHAERPI